MVAGSTIPNDEERQMTIEQPTQARTAWDEIATGYDRTNTPSQMWLGNEGLRRAGLRPGMKFLDVAAGSGALAVPAARVGARVVAVDLSPDMLQLLERRARDEGLEIEARVMDGHALELADASFDIAGSQFGVMLFADMPRGIAEMARVVKPGGRVLMNVYGDPHEIEFLGFFVTAVQAAVPAFEGPPMDPIPLPFQLQDPARLEAELAATGLSDVKVETITEETRFQSGEQMWDWLVHSNPIVGEILAELNLDAEATAGVRDRLDELVRERAGDDGVAVLRAPINIGVGTKAGPGR
jgi:ubiquinone/menaquinone biosynthesis C-methylase UbiE